jgi:uncharacterized protein YdiU (UPF0061 family)
MHFGFQHSYAGLTPRFYFRVEPSKVEQPKLLVFNDRLAEELGLDPGAVAPEAAAIFSGNQLPDDARPIAMAYAGHQFGGFVPRLGDGRAILLGELKGRDGVLRDVQLKGSGLTPFSRNGDGRAAVGPMLREYLISEAMHAFGIPTTRSLAVVATGEKVYREDVLPGAVLTRIGASHIRVGTFQYFAVREDLEALRELLGYVIARHYPEAATAESPALAVLKAVTSRQASLIAHWMRVGFIHGVMNTDNMAISGETIDYGPCAFMDGYSPARVFSSIDQNGRYAFANQPVIAQWNLARFAETLLPLVDADEATAIALATDIVRDFMPQFDANFLQVMRAKLGFANAEEGDSELIRQLFGVMDAAEADFTLTFRRLADVAAAQAGEGAARAVEGAAAQSFTQLFAGKPGTAPADIEAWLASWLQRLERESILPSDRAIGMRRVSPAYIPRNHRVEAALSAASSLGDLTLFDRLLQIVQQPYDDQPDAAEYALPPEPSERVFQTFCGT